MEEAFRLSLIWYSCGAYPKLADLSPEQLQQVIDSVSLFTSEVGPFRNGKGKFPHRDVPYFGSISIIHAIAVGGATLVKSQVESGYEEHIKSMNSNILTACLEGYHMWTLGKS